MRTSGKQTSASNGRLKITLPNLTYPKAWAGSVPLCPVIFSWLISLTFFKSVLGKREISLRLQNLK